MNKLSLDNELLKPMKEKLEDAINMYTKNAILTGKESEITLKISVRVTKKGREFNDEIEEYLQPTYEFQFTEKIKEDKNAYKGMAGFDYAVELNDDNEVVLKNINEQQSLFGRED